jgi:adenosylcobinamide-phosphate synthase
MGDIITYYETLLNTRSTESTKGRTEGVIALSLLLAAVGLVAIILQVITMALPYGWIINAVMATSLLAQKSMREHVGAVADALSKSITDGRKEVAKIVGRDTSQLDESGISRASLESLAENTSDGIVAPAFWYVIAGLPGLALYKAINTADSMIGHKTPQYLYFGWAAAKLDDLVNWAPARLTALIVAAIAKFSAEEDGNKIWSTIRRDAPKHQSPNAGWPETAFAMALGLQFGGPRAYGGDMLELPTMGEGRTDMTKDDIIRGLALFDIAMLVLAAVLALIAYILSIPGAILPP